jgi:hypothetical protein
MAKCTEFPDLDTTDKYYYQKRHYRRKLARDGKHARHRSTTGEIMLDRIKSHLDILRLMIENGSTDYAVMAKLVDEIEERLK